MQKLSIASDRNEFDEQTNIMLSEGNWVVQGTSYVVTISETRPVFCSIVLQNNEGQILITAVNLGAFVAEIESYLNSNYWVIPGTIYVTNTGPEIILEQEERTLSTFYTIFVGE